MRNLPILAAIPILLAALAGCTARPAVQHEAIAGDTLFVADSRNGQVRVFDLRGPTAHAVLIASARRTVLDLRLDAVRGRLWVLGDDALYAYDVRTLALLDSRTLPGNTAVVRTLELLEDGTPLLVSAGLRIPVRKAG